MARSRLLGLVLVAGASLAGCIPQVEDTEQVPLTTSSPSARATYIEGRDLAENLRFTEARERFRAAVDEDPQFAMAHLALANSAATASEFFEHMRRATELADGVSEGERWMIDAGQAALESDTARQLDRLNQLAEAFPEDPRAHTLLGVFHFGQQAYPKAIVRLQRAASLDLDFAPPHNLLGYALRFEGRFEEAEEAFRRYIELIPDEPNPYDSYAELLMKLGRFDEAIAQYRKALERDPDFAASHLGIGVSQLLGGNPDTALETFSGMLAGARDLPQKRQALTALAIREIHLGEADAAIGHLEARRALAADGDDHATVAADEVAIGTVLVEFGRPDDAQARFGAAMEAIGRADVPAEVRAAAARNQLYNLARVALARGDLGGAKATMLEFRQEVAASGVPAETRQVKEIAGAIALAEKDYARAVRSLRGADNQNPRVLYMSALALRGLDTPERARDLCESAANFNGLGMNYAFVRGKAQALLAEL